MVINLLREIQTALERAGRTEDEILFVTDGTYSSSWLDFKDQIADLTYNNSYGLVEINVNLKIVGYQWWLERYTYDGNEWWVYKTCPKNPAFPGSLMVKYELGKNPLI